MISVARLEGDIMDSSIFKADTVAGITIITLKLDYIEADQNRELRQVFSALDYFGGKKVIVDLSSTAYISSMVLSTLVFFLKTVKKTGGDLVMCGINARIKEILATTKLDKLFSIRDSRGEAMAFFDKKIGQRSVWDRIADLFKPRQVTED